MGMDADCPECDYHRDQGCTHCICGRRFLR